MNADNGPLFKQRGCQKGKGGSEEMKTIGGKKRRGQSSPTFSSKGGEKGGGCAKLLGGVKVEVKDMTSSSSSTILCDRLPVKGGEEKRDKRGNGKQGVR